MLTTIVLKIGVIIVSIGIILKIIWDYRDYLKTKIKWLLKKIWHYIVNRNAGLEATIFFFLTIFWLLFALLYFLAASVTEGVLIKTGKAMSDNALLITNMLFAQTKILASFVIVSIVLYGYQMYQRIGIKRIIQREGIDVIR
jgi:hypothetical protein